MKNTTYQNPKNTLQMAETSNRIKLNIGGTRFETTMTTLNNFKDGVLYKSVIGNFAKPVDGEYYFDRNPTIFSYILDYYRTNVLCFSESIPRQLINEELDYWGIDELAECIDSSTNRDHLKAAISFCDWLLEKYYVDPSEDPNDDNSSEDSYIINGVKTQGKWCENYPEDLEFVYCYPSFVLDNSWVDKSQFLYGKIGSTTVKSMIIGAALNCGFLVVNPSVVDKISSGIEYDLLTCYPFEVDKTFVISSFLTYFRKNVEDLSPNPILNRWISMNMGKILNDNRTNQVVKVMVDSFCVYLRYIYGMIENSHTQRIVLKLLRRRGWKCEIVKEKVFCTKQKNGSLYGNNNEYSSFPIGTKTDIFKYPIFCHVCANNFGSISNTGCKIKFTTKVLKMEKY